METETATITALALIESTPPMQLFAPGALDPILDRVRADARAAAAKLDISTEDGRKAIASLALKVARTKTFMEARRVDLVAERKREVAAIDCEGRRFRLAMEELKDEVRKPLTDWEDAEKKRVHDLAGRVQAIQDIGAIPFANLAQVASLAIVLDELWNHNFEEFTEPATKAHERARLHLQAAETRIKRAEADRVEAELKQAAADEKARLAREAKIAEDARAEAEAEAKRRQDALDLAAKQREAELNRVAAEEKARLEREKEDANERARKAEADRQKAEDVRLAAEEEQRKREQDRAHRGKINREAVAALIKSGVGELTAKTVVELIARKLITHVSINY